MGDLLLIHLTEEQHKLLRNLQQMQWIKGFFSFFNVVLNTANGNLGWK